MELDNDPEGAFIYDLRKLARIDDNTATTFFIQHENTRVHVKYVSGSSASVEFEVAYDAVARHVLPPAAGVGSYRGSPLHDRLRAVRPMMVHLSPEQAVHGSAKASGVDVEHQTGDAAFDNAVYIDAPSADPLPRLFVNPVVRAAVLTLFKLDFRSITIDDKSHRIVAYTTTFADRQTSANTATPAADAILAFVQLATGLPPVDVHIGVHPGDQLSKPARWLATFGAIASCVAPAVYFLLAGKRCPSGEDLAFAEAIGCIWPGAISIAFTLVLAALVMAIVRPSLVKRYGGTSSSSKRISAFCWSLALVIFSLLAPALGIMIAQLAP